MKLEILIGGLANANAAIRLDVVRVLGMTDEVLALDALRARYVQEPDPTVKQTIAWAGKRLHQAQQAGYSTLDEIFRQFAIDREIEHTPDAVEAEMERQLDNQFANELNQMRVSSHRKQLGLSAVAGLGLGMVGGASMGLSAAMTGLTAGAGASGTSLDGPRPQLGTTRTPPTAPTNADISLWLKRLRESPQPAQREAAIIELAGLNNPIALPHLAATFIIDESPQVRQTAQRFGKLLYWNSVYWEMEQDGRLRAEMDRRLQLMGKRTEKEKTGTTTAPAPRLTAGDVPPSAPPAPSAESQVDVGEILRKAKEARQARKRK